MAAKAKAAAKKAAKAPAKKAAKTAKPVKAPVKKVAKVVAKAVAKPAKKGTPAKKPEPGKAPARVSPGRPPKIVRPATVPVPAANVVPAVRVAAPAAQPPASARDLAAAHEYLLSRSASRSEEPVVVNGRKLPTEEELLKMSDADYMNHDQLAFFKYRLQQMEKELLANAGETTEHLRETVIVPDPADRATIEEEHALELRTRDRERKLLKKVQASLAAIEAGDYGFCEETGDPIGIPRLLARPTATLSLEAQQRREMKQKLFGD
ncbi:MAG: RNA polymerase-binding protein DksA [Gemmatimonadota bacterium]